MKSPSFARFIWGILFFLFHSFAGFADTSSLTQFAVRNWQTDNGLPHNAVTAVQQTRDGYLWIGTWQGVARFDGVHFTVFNPENTPALRGGSIRSFYQTHDETFWICPQDAPVTVLTNGQFVLDPLGFGLPVRAMVETKDGTVWFGTPGGLVRRKDGQSTWFTTANGLVDNMVLALCEDRSGALWIGTGAGVVTYKDGFHDRYDLGNGLRVNGIRALYCDDDNTMWVGTGGGGLVRINGGEVRTFTKADGLPDLFVNFVHKDSRHVLRVGTVSGMARWTGERFTAETDTAYEFCLTEDREGSLWLGTKEGLSQLQNKPFRSLTQQEGLPHNNVTSVLQDHEGTIWATTWGGGLVSVSNGVMRVYNHPTNGVFDLLLSGCETRDGTLWFGAEFDGGLYRFDGKTFTRFGKNEGLIDPVVRVIYEDRDGTLWVGTSGALYSFRDGKFRRFTAAEGLAGNIVRCIYQDRHGILWIGTNDGLTRYHDGTFQSWTTKDGLSDNAVLAIHEDVSDTLWLGTGNGGVDRVTLISDTKGRWAPGQVIAYGTRQGLFNNNILEILEDDTNNLWFSCVSGVFRINKKQFDDDSHGLTQFVNSISFGKIDGMASVQCNGVSKPAGWKAKDGKLWFPTTRGLSVVDPNAVRSSDPPPFVVLQAVIANSVTMIGIDTDAPNQPATNAFNRLLTGNLPPGELIFKAGLRDLEFHYGALSYRAPEKNRFKYRLEGYDLDWVEVDTRRTAYYNNLGPGHYRFSVMGCNSDGIWSENAATVDLVLKPHVWQTAWFLSVVIGLSVVGIAGGARYWTWKKVQRQLLRLEQQHMVERERSRIARDMHDDLGARLTEISVLSDFVGARVNNSDLSPHISRISKASRETVRNLDALVWAINPKNDSIDHLALYIGEYVEMFFCALPMRYSLEIPTDLPATPLSSEERHNLFLTVKETVNNVAKHSHATEMTLGLSYENGILQIAVHDNGNGFEASCARLSSNGIKNMQKRMTDIGGTCEIVSDVNKGTVVTIRLPVA